jgi:hypothetical protein
VACIQQLREEGIEPVGYWYNPNIHPFTEYRARRNCLTEYARSIGLELVVEDEYGLRPFVRAVAGDIDNRCGYCYASRLSRTAQYAAEHGFDAFCTTLTVSPYQDTPRIFETGQAVGERSGVPFAPYDFSPRFREGQAQARELGLYMQKYCGCVFSEEDRYCKGKKKPAPAPSPAPGDGGPA